MQIEGLVAPTAKDTAMLDELVDMMGESFMEENWTRALLDSLKDATYERKLEISRETMRADFLCGIEYPACFATPDLAGCAGAYLRSDLGEHTWSELEDAAHEEMAKRVLAPAELKTYLATAEKIAPVSDFSWEAARAAETGFDDFIHLYVLGVSKKARGTGAFRRLIEPIFAFADAKGVPCYLETYSDNLISLYEHVGFKQIKTLEAPGVALKETLMERLPR